MSKVVDWEALARQLGAFENGEVYSSTMAKQAIEIILGEEIFQSAVDYYISFQLGYELARFVLWQIRPWSAMKHC